MTIRQQLLGASGLRVSQLSLGTMTFAQSDWGTTDRAEAARIFESYIEAGGNFIDTADRYAAGESERWVGDLVRSDRDRLVVATKFGLTRGPGVNDGGTSRKSIVQALDASLQRLGLDRIDLYWMHAWDALTPTSEVMRALDDLVRSGKVLYLGVSDTPAWVVARANTLAEQQGLTPFVAYQGRYSVVDREAEREVLPMAGALEMTFAAFSVLGGGTLSGKYEHGGEGRLSHVGRRDTRERTRQLVDLIGAVADELGVTRSQVALRWAMDRPNVLPIVGARTHDQLTDNLGALDIALSVEHTVRLDEASAITPGFPHDLLNRTEFLFGRSADVVAPAIPRR
jgi:aryl-alcohol dehydrogenase-like predicted oxidoreductase